MRRFAEGIRMIEREIGRYAKSGDARISTISRVQLAEILHPDADRQGKTAAGFGPQELPDPDWDQLFGARRALTLLQEAASSLQLSDRGVIRANINFNLGVLSVMRKKRAEREPTSRRRGPRPKIRARTSCCKELTLPSQNLDVGTRFRGLFATVVRRLRMVLRADPTLLAFGRTEEPLMAALKMSASQQRLNARLAVCLRD